MYFFSDWPHVNDNTTVCVQWKCNDSSLDCKSRQDFAFTFGKKRREKAHICPAERKWLSRVTSNKIHEVYWIKEKKWYFPGCSLSGNLRSGVFFFRGVRESWRRRTTWSQVSHMNERQWVVIIWSWISRQSLPGPKKLCRVPSTEMGRGYSPFDLRLGISLRYRF